MPTTRPVRRRQVVAAGSSWRFVIFPLGTIIERNMVAIREMPEDKAEPNAYHDTALVIGHMAWSDIASDERVVSSKIAALPPWGVQA